MPTRSLSQPLSLFWGAGPGWAVFFAVFVCFLLLFAFVLIFGSHEPSTMPAQPAHARTTREPLANHPCPNHPRTTSEPRTTGEPRTTIHPRATREPPANHVPPANHRRTTYREPPANHPRTTYHQRTTGEPRAADHPRTSQAATAIHERPCTIYQPALAPTQKSLNSPKNCHKFSARQPRDSPRQPRATNKDAKAQKYQQHRPGQAFRR